MNKYQLPDDYNEVMYNYTQFKSMKAYEDAKKEMEAYEASKIADKAEAEQIKIDKAVEREISNRKIRELKQHIATLESMKHNKSYSFFGF